MKKLSKLQLIKEVVMDWKGAELTDYQAILIVSTIIHTQKPTQDAIDWARNVAKSSEA